MSLPVFTGSGKVTIFCGHKVVYIINLPLTECISQGNSGKDHIHPCGKAIDKDCILPAWKAGKT